MNVICIHDIYPWYIMKYHRSNRFNINLTSVSTGHQDFPKVPQGEWGFSRLLRCFARTGPCWKMTSASTLQSSTLLVRRGAGPQGFSGLVSGAEVGGGDRGWHFGHGAGGWCGRGQQLLPRQPCQTPGSEPYPGPWDSQSTELGEVPLKRDQWGFIRRSSWEEVHMLCWY